MQHCTPARAGSWHAGTASVDRQFAKRCPEQKRADRKPWHCRGWPPYTGDHSRSVHLQTTARPAAVPSEHRDGVLTCSHPKHLIDRLHWDSHLSKLLCTFLARANVSSTSMRECFAEQLQRVDRISRAITVRRASKRSRPSKSNRERVGKKLRRAHTAPYYRPHTGHV